jgi:hypothetical protein
MINLDYNEKQWIKLCKLHLKEKYPSTGRWVDNLKGMFTDFYGWNPDTDGNYQDFLVTMFNRLFEIYLKIQDDRSGNNLQLREIFGAAFFKSPARDDDQPIERAISQLCGLIQCNTVLDDNGNTRYNL